MIIHPVPLADVPTVWPIVLPFAQRMAAAQPEDWPLANIEAQADDGRLKLWLILSDNHLIAVGATSIFESHDGKTEMSCRWICGAGPKQWAHLIVEVEKMARELGCSRVLINYGDHAAWTRLLPDYTAKVMVQLSKEL